jgi:hypothetical protein
MHHHDNPKGAQGMQICRFQDGAIIDNCTHGRSPMRDERAAHLLPILPERKQPQRAEFQSRQGRNNVAHRGSGGIY